MTVQIPKSVADRVAPDFSAEVEKHRQALMEHRFSEPATAEHPGTPRPIHHPTVECCIKRVQEPDKPDEFVADYEIIDDTPPPVLPTFEEQKQILMLEISKQENDLIQGIWPRGKQRLDLIREGEILAKFKIKRTAKEKKFLTDLTKLKNKVSSISREAATLHAEIEDLTEKTIKTWKGKLT